jgi:hypothetical protein
VLITDLSRQVVTSYRMTTGIYVYIMATDIPLNSKFVFVRYVFRGGEAKLAQLSVASLDNLWGRGGSVVARRSRDRKVVGSNNARCHHVESLGKTLYP